MKTFEEKLKAMTNKDVVLAMVAGLQDPCTRIDMSTFGVARDGICYGCAATNAICKVAGLPMTADIVNDWPDTAVAFNADYQTIRDFEYAINALRTGDVGGYNFYIRELGEDFNHLQVMTRGVALPVLNDNYTAEDLQAYTDYANAL